MVLRRVALGTAAAVFATAPAFAAPPVALEWSAPDGCPGREGVVAAIERLVGSTEETLPVSVVVTAAGDRFTAELRTPGGLRQIDGESCRSVAAAAIVIVALAIDPNADTGARTFPELDATNETGGALATLEEGSRAPVTPLPPPAQAERPRDAPPPAAPADVGPTAPPASRDADARSPHFGASAKLVGEVGMLPGPSFGPQVAVHFGVEPLWATVGVGFIAARTVRLPEDASRGGDVYWAGGELDGCSAPWADLPLHGCVGMEAGALHGSGFGADDPASGTALWLAPLVAAGVHSWLGEGAVVTADLGLAVPIFRPEFGILGHDPLHRPAAVSGRLAVGIGYR